MISSSFSPTGAKALMAGGVVPFAALAAALHVWPQPMLAYALLSYASIIVSFIAGTHWAFVFADTSIRRPNLLIILSNVIALLGWAGFCLHFTGLSELILIGCLLAQLEVDLKWLAPLHPLWYRRWRMAITLLVCACLLLAYFAPLS